MDDSLAEDSDGGQAVWEVLEFLIYEGNWALHGEWLHHVVVVLVDAFKSDCTGGGGEHCGSKSFHVVFGFLKS